MKNQINSDKTKLTILHQALNLKELGLELGEDLLRQIEELE